METNKDECLKFWHRFHARRERVQTAVAHLEDDAACEILMRELELLVERLGWSEGTAERLDGHVSIGSLSERRNALTNMVSSFSVDCGVATDTELLISGDAPE